MAISLSSPKVCRVRISNFEGGFRTSMLLEVDTALYSFLSSLPSSCSLDPDPDPEQEHEELSWQVVSSKKPSLELDGEACWCALTYPDDQAGSLIDQSPDPNPYFIIFSCGSKDQSKGPP